MNEAKASLLDGNMKGLWSIQTLGTTHTLTQHHISEDWNVRQYHY